MSAQREKGEQTARLPDGTFSSTADAAVCMERACQDMELSEH
jgi:hypothetical protein